LTRLEIPFTETPAFCIYLNGDLNAHQIIKSIDTPLTLVKTHAPTLEDAYLQIVGYE